MNRCKLLLSLFSFCVFNGPACAQAVNPDAQAPRVIPVNAQSYSEPKAPSGSQLPSLGNQVSGFYLTGGLGANWPQTVNVEELTNLYGLDYGFRDYHFSGPSIEAGIGYDFGTVRAEVTYAYDRSGLSSYSDQFGVFQYSGGDVAKNSVFASVYWDINLGSRIVPYVGGGLGYSNLSVESSSSDSLNFNAYGASSFGYQAKIGLSYLASRQTDVFAEAVYRGMSGFNVSSQDLQYKYGNYNSWGFLLGARFRFSR